MLDSKPANIPTNPGVYRWSDENGRVIYVGKANNLRSRLNSYFQPLEKLHPRTAKMVQTAKHLEWTIVQNETEALTLEFNQINQFEPRFNVIFRFDDKSYPYLAFSNDNFPRVFITRRRGHKNYKYYGPFPKAWAIKSTYTVLQETFQFRSCSAGVFASARRRDQPCLLGYINKCSAPCVSRISEADYDLKLTKLRRFLQGDILEVKKEVEAQMLQFAKNEQFELAAVRRDQLASIEVIDQHNAMQFDILEKFDVVAVSGDEYEVGVHIFRIRSGRIVAENSYVAQRGLVDNDRENIIDSGGVQSNGDIVRDVLLNLYSNADAEDIPGEICVSDLMSDYVILENIIASTRGYGVNLHTVARGKKRELVMLAIKNAEETLAKARRNRRSDIVSRQQALNEISMALNLKQPPLRIECYDISHTLGQWQVGAMVVFEEGLPKKKDYRLFNLKGEFVKFDKEGVPDDTAAIYEVLRRRLAHISNSNTAEVADAADSVDSPKPSKHFAYTPQLLLIDGGLPQVNAAYRAVVDAGLSNRIEVASLAKRLEEIWLYGEEYPIILPRNSLGLYMLQHLRDEAHDFSIRSMRRRRRKSIVKSKLNGVNGLGVVKQKLLLRKIGSVKRVIEAAKTPDLQHTLLEIPGITQKIVDGIAGLE